MYTQGLSRRGHWRTRTPGVRGRLADYLFRMRGVTLMLDGREIMALGVEEGPEVGEMLRALLMARLDGEVSSREDEERFREAQPGIPVLGRAGFKPAPTAVGAGFGGFRGAYPANPPVC